MSVVLAESGGCPLPPDPLFWGEPRKAKGRLRHVMRKVAVTRDSRRVVKER
jgi:hypothetical protein